MQHDIGALKRREADANREAVRAYFGRNPFNRQSECAAELGLSVMTVSRHVRAIRRELAKAKPKPKKGRTKK